MTDFKQNGLLQNYISFFLLYSISENQPCFKNYSYCFYFLWAYKLKTVLACRRSSTIPKNSTVPGYKTGTYNKTAGVISIQPIMKAYSVLTDIIGNCIPYPIEPLCARYKLEKTGESMWEVRMSWAILPPISRENWYLPAW